MSSTDLRGKFYSRLVVSHLEAHRHGEEILKQRLEDLKRGLIHDVLRDLPEDQPITIKLSSIKDDIPGFADTVYDYILEVVPVRMMEVTMQRISYTPEVFREPEVIEEPVSFWAKVKEVYNNAGNGVEYDG